MNTLKKKPHYFSGKDLTLWSCSLALITISFYIFDRVNYMTYAASIIGATSLVFNAKGNPFGQFLMVVFSALYGIISYSCSYFGEMITYLGMTGPMALLALMSRLRNPCDGNKAEVKVNQISRKEMLFMYMLSIVTTIGFFFILKAFNTSNLVLSTLSVTTSFIAVYLTFRRSSFFALAYAANDIVLIVLWMLAAKEDISYTSVLICFVTFLLNDIYGFISWTHMEKRQQKAMAVA